MQPLQSKSTIERKCRPCHKKESRKALFACKPPWAIWLSPKVTTSQGVLEFKRSNMKLRANRSTRLGRKSQTCLTPTGFPSVQSRNSGVRETPLRDPQARNRGEPLRQPRKCYLGQSFAGSQDFPGGFYCFQLGSIHLLLNESHLVFPIKICEIWAIISRTHTFCWGVGVHNSRKL